MKIAQVLENNIFLNDIDCSILKKVIKGVKYLLILLITIAKRAAAIKPPKKLWKKP
jgi:hypothetical protein